MERTQRGWVWPAFAGLLVGVGLGLLAGLVVWPVEYDSITPDLLAADHQDDYAMMIVTAYASPLGSDYENLDLARARLARLGPIARPALMRIVGLGDDAGAAAAKLLDNLGPDAAPRSPGD